MWIGNTIIALILLALAVAGAWRWYDSHMRAQTKNQVAETASQDVRETAECHLEAFKLRPGLTETDLEIQAAFMDICMAAELRSLKMRLSISVAIAGLVCFSTCVSAQPNKYELQERCGRLFEV
jgi:hypothetical protein